MHLRQLGAYQSAAVSGSLATTLILILNLKPYSQVSSMPLRRAFAAMSGASTRGSRGSLEMLVF